MSINKINMITFVAIFVILQVIKTVSADPFDVDRFVGKWYGLGVISPTYNYSDNIKCSLMEVMKLNDGEHSFKQESKLVINGYANNFYGYGEVRDSTVQSLLPYRENVTSTYTVTSVDNGRELIFHDKNDPQYHELIARNPFVPMDTKKQFERLATNCDVQAVYFAHEGCTYKTISVGKHIHSNSVSTPL